jgi:hypothetical protein
MASDTSTASIPTSVLPRSSSTAASVANGGSGTPFRSVRCAGRQAQNRVATRPRRMRGRRMAELRVDTRGHARIMIVACRTPCGAGR